MPLTAIHQLVNRLAWGDAIGDQLRMLQRHFRARGLESEIYARETDARSRAEARPAADWPRASRPGELLLVHHGFETRLLPVIERSRGPVMIAYHNITPAHFFEPFDAEVAAACRRGRDELRALTQLARGAVAYSEYSARELRAFGMADVRAIPFGVRPKAAVEPDAALAAELGDGRRNLLFVGRAVPNKRVEDVLRVFAGYQKLFQPHSRLVIAGHVDRERAYGTWLFALRDALELDHVRILGRVSEAQLSACYRHAHAYLSMSEHEGFGAPLVEAMMAGVPVVARAAAAVPDTLGDAGVLLPSADPVQAAKVLAALDASGPLRAELIAHQRERAMAFDEAAAVAAWDELLESWSGKAMTG